MKPKKSSRKILIIAPLLLLFCIFQTGCEYAGSLALTGVTMGIAYYYTNVADQTFSFDLERMNRASLMTLKRLGFAIRDQTIEEEERKIKAETEDLDIIIKLKWITHTCTKVTVKVREGIKMDKATALELIVQTGEMAEKLTDTIGTYTFKVAIAPLDWPLTRDEIESIDSLPPKEAIRQYRVASSPYVVNGKQYVPVSVAEARTYRERGLASWYGDTAPQEEGSYMTANGEVFDPKGLSAAHKYLPLPSYVRVTNLRNHRSIIVRVNDRGPFVSGRIINLSAGAARKLGFYKNGVAHVLVETITVEE